MVPELFLLALLTQAPAITLAPTVLPPLVEDVSAASPDHKRLAVATVGDGVWVLDVAASTVLLRIPSNGSRASSIAWSPDGATLAILSRAALLDIVDSATGAVRITFPTCQGRVAFVAGGSVVAVALGPRPAGLWRTKDGERLASLSVNENRKATAMAVSRDGELLALGDEDGAVGIFRTGTGVRLHGPFQVPAGEDNKQIFALDFDPKGQTLAIAGGDCIARLWTPTSGAVRELRNCEEDIFGGLAVGQIQFSPDGQRLLITTFTYWEGRVWDLANGKVIDSLSYEGGNPVPMPAWFSSDGTCFTMSMDCWTKRIGQPSPLAGKSRWKKWVWYGSDGDIAWVEMDGAFHVRRVRDGTFVLKLPIRTDEPR